MKKILLLVAVLLTQTLSAQIVRGDSELFSFTPDGDTDNYRTELGFIRHYIGTKGESTYFVISIPGDGNPVKIEKNKSVFIKFADGKYIKTQVHSVKSYKLSKPYARKKFYTTIVECPIDENEFCKKRIKGIYIEMNEGNEYEISIGYIWSRVLKRELPGYFTNARKVAQKKKERKEFFAEEFETPNNIQRFIEENHSDKSYRIIGLDTVNLPITAVSSLNYFITKETIELENRINENLDYDSLQARTDSIVKEFKKEVDIYEAAYNNPKPAKYDGNDYQRAVVELIDHNGNDTIKLLTRIGEEEFSSVNFYREIENCRKGISEIEEVLERMRSLQEPAVEEQDTIAHKKVRQYQ